MDTDRNLTSGSLDIAETVDGVPAAEAVVKMRSSKKETELPRKKNADGYLWGIYLVILMFSIVELYSASSTEVTSKSLYGPLISHAKFLVMGLGIMYFFQRLHYRVFRKWAWFAAIVCACLVILSNYVGVNINGAQRALSLPGGFTIQPPEIAKLAVVLVLARRMAKYQKDGGVTTRGIIESAVVVAVFAGLLWRNGLTNTIILMVVSVAMFVIGGIEWKKLLIVLAVYGVCVAGVYGITHSAPEAQGDEFEQLSSGSETEVKKTGVDRTETRENRFASFIKGVNPDDDLTDENRQVFFSNIAQAHGGIFGNGPGSSRESARLPLAFSDYIFSIIIEDTGFVGGVILLLCYLMFPLRSGTIAGKCSRAFPALLIMGCSVLIITQALIHMAIATGLFPVSGQPLPSISKGGTSILVMSAALGMMLSVSRYAVRNGNKKDINNELRGLPVDIQSANPMQL